MIDNITAAGAGSVYPIKPTNGANRVAPTQHTPADTTIPDTPPAEVLHALDQAQQTVSELAGQNLELRFDVADGQIRAQLVDNTGTVVREMPARHGLDLLAGQNLIDQHA